MTDKKTHYLVFSTSNKDSIVPKGTPTGFASFSSLEKARLFIAKHKDMAEKYNMEFFIEPIVFEG